MTTLSKVLTDEAFEHTIPVATRFTEGVQSVIDENQLAWSVTKLGARAEYRSKRCRLATGLTPARRATTNSSASCTSTRSTVECLITPIHNMALMSPSTTEADVDRHTELFRDAVLELLA